MSYLLLLLFAISFSSKNTDNGTMELSLIKPFYLK